MHATKIFALIFASLVIASPVDTATGELQLVFKGDAPADAAMCWNAGRGEHKTSCPRELPHGCGILCSRDEKACRDFDIAVVAAVAIIAKDLAQQAYKDAAIRALNLINGLRYTKQCTEYEATTESDNEQELLRAVTQLMQLLAPRIAASEQ